MHVNSCLILFFFFFSCANAKKWEIELTTLKSNNNRLTSALQESTANVDEWKRQLHTYKEENLRLKREMDAMKPSIGGAGNNAVNEINEDMRIENIKLKSRIITLEKEIQELQIKASKSNVKDKSNEQSVSRHLDKSRSQMIYILSWHHRVYIIYASSLCIQFRLNTIQYDLFAV